jgi:CelD/BcsL family acetyltransferase involved in cellulose biosynthesis
MGVCQIDPVQDPRWRLFLERHPCATVFHTPEWLTALQHTYGYEPAALTTAAPGESLSNGLVFCRVKSWLTGRRTTSLPFSDHCEPLVESVDVLERLLEGLKQDLSASRARYLEIRPVSSSGEIPAGFRKADTFCFHQLNLAPSLEELFRGFHKDCVQRKIRRAEREALHYEEGRSEALLERFYSLLVLTRQRQRLLPQPRIWFRNLVACMGDMLKIRLASKDGHPVAAMLTLQYRETLVYKYGCSDKTFSQLGGMPFLFWKAIQGARNSGLRSLDLGRADWDNPGLLTFKDRLGATRSVLEYWRYGGDGRVSIHSGWQTRFAQRIFQHLPNNWLPIAGSLVYRHLA